MEYKSYAVLIRNNETGEVRRIEVDLPWNEGSHYWWTEGNFGCDCNRELEFRRANEEFGYDNLYCGTGKFSVLKAIFPDGTELPIDAEGQPT